MLRETISHLSEMKVTVSIVACKALHHLASCHLSDHSAQPALTLVDLKHSKSTLTSGPLLLLFPLLRGLTYKSEPKW